MFSQADRYLLGRAPAASCCGYCCCRKNISLRSAVLWTSCLLIIEAVWHISISILRPLWEWNTTLVTIIAFLCQDVARIIVLAASIRVINGVRKYTSTSSSECSNVYLVKVRVQFLWKTLLGLILLEVLEMTVKWFSVESICDAPYVTEAREKRNPNMTAVELKAAQDRCMLISDLYDYVLELITIVLLIYLTWITHSYGRSVRGVVIEQQNPANYQQAESENSNVVIGEIVATSSSSADV